MYTALLFWMWGSGSHSIRGSTFRIVSSFTFFPRGSRLLGWRQRLLRPAVPWRDVSSGPRGRADVSSWSRAWAEFSGFAFCWSGQHQCTHHDQTARGVQAGGRRGPGAGGGPGQEAPGCAAVSCRTGGRSCALRTPAPRTDSCQVTCVSLLSAPPLGSLTKLLGS